MLQQLKKCVIALSLAFVSVSAYSADATDQPLMIIRFNQEHVAYERALYTTLSRALEVRPAAHFEIMSVIPRVQDQHEQAGQDSRAAHNLEQVKGTIKEMGMPDSRLTITKTHEDVATSEVRIFVQ